MITFTHHQQEQLRQLGVAAVYLFGSFAEGRAGALSDVDFGILFKDKTAIAYQSDSRALYQALYEILTDAVRLFGDHRVDIVMLQRTNLETQFDVITHGQVLFLGDETARENFEHNTTMLYADYKPTLRRFDEAVLQHI